MSENELQARLDSHIAAMAPHQKARAAGRLLLEARDCITELRRDAELMKDALDAWGVDKCDDMPYPLGSRIARATQMVGLMEQELKQFREALSNFSSQQAARGSRRVVFEFDERSFATIDDLKKRGFKFDEIVVRNTRRRVLIVRRGNGDE